MGKVCFACREWEVLAFLRRGSGENINLEELAQRLQEDT